MEKYFSWYTLFLYVILAIVVSLLFKKSIIEKNKNSKIKIFKHEFKKKYIYYFIIYIIFILFSCYRVTDGEIVGADTQNYINYFNTLGYVHFDLKETFLFSGYEYLFYNLMYLVRVIGGTFFHFSIIIYSLIIISCIVVVDKTMYDEKNSWWTILFFLPLLKSLNIVRICVASFIGYVAIQYLCEGKEKQFLFLSLISFLNHYIAIILFAFYIFYKLIKDNLFEKRKLIILSNIVMIVLSFLVLPLAKYLLKNSGFVGYLSKIEISLIGYIPIVFFYLAMLYEKKIILYVKKKKHFLYYKMMVFITFVLPIFILLNGASRILLFFEIPRYILYGDICAYYLQKANKKYYKICGFSIIVGIILWLTFRIYRIWYGYGLMPYLNTLFD